MDSRFGSFLSRAHQLRSAAAIAIPVLLVAALVASSFEVGFLDVPPLLLPILNTVFLALASWAVAYVAFTSYLKKDQPAVLAMGCGVLALGTGSLISGWVLSPLDTNVAVTVYNTAALVGGGMHLTGAVLTATGQRIGRGRLRPKVRLALAAGGVLLVLAITWFLSGAGLLPTFFVQGAGPTFLRQLVEGAAALCYCVGALLFVRIYFNSHGEFFFWYAAALGLTGGGLLATLLPTTVGDLTTWIGRVSQYLGGLSFVLAVLILLAETQARGVSLATAIAGLFREAELNYRALVETSPVAIVVTNREGSILIWNPAAESVFRRPREAVLGASLADVIPVAPPGPDLAAVLRQLVAEGRTQKTGHVQVRHPESEGPLEIEYAVSARETDAGWVGTFVMRNLTERVRLQRELRETNAQLEQRVQDRTAELAAANQQLRSLSAHLRSVREEERMRISADLHNELGQILTALRIEVAILCDMLQDPTPSTREQVGQLEAISTLAGQGDEIVRRFIADLRPWILDELGLSAAVEWELTQFRSRSDLAATFESNWEGKELPLDQRTALFRVLQEALANVLRHAQASAVQVRLDRSDGYVTLEVRDNGVGLPAEGARRAGHFGLLAMHESMDALGGTLGVESVPGQGTTVRARIPLPVAAGAE